MKEWKELTVNEYAQVARPINSQPYNLHKGDVEFLVPLLREQKPKVIVEIGAGYGTSSRLFGGIAKECGGKVYSIEPKPRKEWYDNINAYELQDTVELIEAASPWVNWDGKEIDVLFIDGFHNFRNVISDYFFWDRYVKTGGLVIFHDTNNFTGVRRAIEEIKRTEQLEYVGKARSRVGLETYRKIQDPRGRVAFFGPWVGEFGWEVAWWQGVCRKEAKNWDYVIVSSYPGHEGFYEDFANEFQPHNIEGQPMCSWANGMKGDFEYPTVPKVFAPPDKKIVSKAEQEYIQFGQDNPNTTYDVLIGVSGHGKKQYPHWDVILKQLEGKKVACFGKTGKYPDGHLEGTDDIRDIPVKELCRHMAGAKLVLGPCTGAMHLVSYCNGKIVVWSDSGGYTGGQTLRKRFEDLLNPFGNPVTVIDQYGWQPPVEEIINAIAKYI